MEPVNYQKPELHDEGGVDIFVDLLEAKQLKKKKKASVTDDFSKREQKTGVCLEV